MTRKQIMTVLGIIGIILLFLLLVYSIKTVIDLYFYNKCFMQPYDSNFDYNICMNYLDY